MTTAPHEHDGPHDQDGPHDHDGPELHGHGHGHGEHAHRGGVVGFVQSIFAPHSRDAADSVDSALEGSGEGIRAVKISLTGLGVTALLQLLVVFYTGSVALLADTIHNFPTR